MADKANVTNAMRLARAAGIDFEVRTYEVDEDDLSGITVARKTGMPPEQVFKTLLLRGDKTGPIVCLLPVELNVNLKALAALSHNKSVEMAAQSELLALTGYVRGGCSPIGMKKKYPTYIDETCLLSERIAVSAGMRGAQMLLAPSDLIAFCGATVCDVGM